MSRATRVLVTGAAGQVGVDLVDTLRGAPVPGADEHYWADGRRVDAAEFDVLALTRHDVDFTNEAALVRAVATARADVIVNLAAYTAVDRAETDAAACYAVNDAAVGALSRAAAEIGSHLITISTDYVFDGTKGAPYVEDDPTGPLNVYGASKLAGERRCSALDTIVRTSWVMGARGRNVLRVIAQRAASGDTVRFVDDQTGTVTVAADLARALVGLIRERPGGTWHVANEGATTWFDVAAFAGRELGRSDVFATAISTSDLVPAPAATRPARADLSTDKFVAAGFRPPPPWRDALARLLAARDASW
ncbi:MAG: dTDP-4-dehydrorhamnose reductase [Acidobacteriota bacterium]|nr:dTDP-4-dehydrorhamnose reductase [Acidobacteriota bacterium]